MSPSTIMPAAAALLRRSRVRASAHRDRPVTTGSVSGPGRTAPSAMASASIVADAGIDYGVEDVDQKINTTAREVSTDEFCHSPHHLGDLGGGHIGRAGLEEALVDIEDLQHVPEGAGLTTRPTLGMSRSMRAGPHPRIRLSCASPSVRAAGPGCRMMLLLISCSAPVRTAGTVSKPGRLATLPGTNRLPHQEPMITSGCAATTSSGLTRRPFALGARDRSAKTSIPPAISTSSETQRMPVIIGSSHSSK